MKCKTPEEVMVYDLQTEIRRLRHALRKYGRHRGREAGCDKYNPDKLPQGGKCMCGFDKALRKGKV